jgi:hypothetical protein
MTYFKILSYIIVVLIILFALFSSVYYIKPFKYIAGCPVNKNISNGNEFEWILEDEIKKFTKLEDDYIKSKK